MVRLVIINLLKLKAKIDRAIKLKTFDSDIFNYNYYKKSSNNEFDSYVQYYVNRAKIEYGENIVYFNNRVMTVKEYKVYTENGKYYIIINGEKVYGKPYTDNPLLNNSYPSAAYSVFPLICWEIDDGVYALR